MDYRDSIHLLYVIFNMSHHSLNSAITLSVNFSPLLCYLPNVLGRGSMSK